MARKPAERQKSRILISYAHMDGQELARQLNADLRKDGNDVWMDETRLLAGSSWNQEIEEKIDTCDAVVALLNRGSYLSDILQQTCYGLSTGAAPALRRHGARNHSLEPHRPRWTAARLQELAKEEVRRLRERGQWDNESAPSEEPPRQN